MCEEVTTPITGPPLLLKMNQEPLNIRLSLNNMARQLMGCTYCGTDTEIEVRFQKLLSAIREPNSKYHILISEKLHESLVVCVLFSLYIRISYRYPMKIKKHPLRSQGNHARHLYSF